jgi:hypothetical protein
MAANDAYRAKGLECLSLAECMHDPEKRAERLRFQKIFGDVLSEPVPSQLTSLLHRLEGR